MRIDDGHHQRARFLQPLSKTCKAMRLRLLPWIWNLIEPSRCGRSYWANFSTNLTALVKTIRADTSLATSVMYLVISPCPWTRLTCVLPRFMTVDRPFIPSSFKLSVSAPALATTFTECLESLPNLHTLEIGSEEDTWLLSSRYFRQALMFAKLPQIKALILPPSAHHFLKPCTNVEDVDWVVGSRPAVISDEFLRSLASIQDSKIKRMAIPLILPGSPSRK